MKCRICDGEASRQGFCDHHQKAYENILEKYRAWKVALDISWKEYLSEIVKNPLTGEWARQVSDYLSNHEGKLQ